MPVIKSAKKKLQQDKRATLRNAKVEIEVKALIKAARKSKTDESLRKATQAIDKAAKRNIFHKNKAARMKSSLAKLLAQKEPKAEAAPKTTKPAKKAAKK